MSLSRDSRAEKKVKAMLRARMALKQRWERIDYEEDVVIPAIDAMKAGKSVLGLPGDAALAFDVVVENAVPNPSDPSESR